MYAVAAGLQSLEPVHSVAVNGYPTQRWASEESQEVYPITNRP